MLVLIFSGVTYFTGFQLRGNDTIINQISVAYSQSDGEQADVYSLLGLYSLFSNVFGWDNLPLLGELVPLVQNLGGSGIWYYLIGFLVGVGAIVATLVGEVLAE